MKTARQRILEYIQAHRAVTTAEICQALKTTEANVRHHISILIDLDLIEVIGQRPAEKKGRPARIFGPSARSQGDNLGLLADILLDEVLECLPSQEKDDLIEAIARSVADRIRSIPQPESERGVSTGRLRSENLSARLLAAIQRLNKAHYQARWEARPDAPRLILGHCPFGDLPARRPEICRVDARLLEELIGQPAEQLKRLAKDGRGATYCMFRIGPPDSKHSVD